MAFSLTKKEEMQRQELITALRDAHTPLDQAQSKDPVDQEEVDKLSALFVVIANEAEEFRTSVIDRWQEEFNNKSEKWQEGDKADDAQSLIDEWEGVDFDSERTEDFEMFAGELEDLASGVD